MNGDIDGENDIEELNKIAGLNTTLPFEEFEQMYQLPILEKDLLEVFLKNISKFFFLDECDLFLG